MTIRTKLAPKDFEKILYNYNIGTYKKHKHIPQAYDNTVYVLWTSKGKYVIKISECHSIESVKFQLKVVTLLTEKKFSIPPIIKTIDDKNHILYNKKWLFVQKFFDGKYVYSFSNKEVFNFGKLIAKLTILLSRFKNIDFLGGTYVGDWGYHKLKKNFREDCHKILSQIDKLDHSKLKKNLIHADLGGVNMLRNKQSKIVFIDWADLHKDYRVFELAVPIAQILTKEKLIRKNQIKLLLKGYQTFIKLNNEEIKALYFIILYRLLGAMNWCISQCKRHPDEKTRLMSSYSYFAARYKQFKNWPLEDFMKFVA